MKTTTTTTTNEEECRRQLNSIRMGQNSHVWTTAVQWFCLHIICECVMMRFSIQQFNTWKWKVVCHFAKAFSGETCVCVCLLCVNFFVCVCSFILFIRTFIRFVRLHIIHILRKAYSYAIQHEVKFSETTLLIRIFIYANIACTILSSRSWA